MTWNSITAGNEFVSVGPLILISTVRTNNIFEGGTGAAFTAIVSTDAVESAEISPEKSNLET